MKIWKSVAPSTRAFSIMSRGHADHVVAQEVDRERQAKARYVPARRRGSPLPMPMPIVELQQRDQRQLQRHHQQADNRGNQQQGAAREFHPRQRIGGKGRDEDRDDGRRDGHRQRVEERLCHIVRWRCRRSARSCCSSPSVNSGGVVAVTKTRGPRLPLNSSVLSSR